MTIADWAPRHVRPYLEAVIAAIQADPRVVGITAGGSAGTGTMDEFSDLDLVVVCRDEHQPELLRDAPALVRRTSAEAASLDYLAQIEAAARP
jgi:predicted nucleotidyltransferase